MSLIFVLIDLVGLGKSRGAVAHYVISGVICRMKIIFE